MPDAPRTFLQKQRERRGVTPRQTWHKTERTDADRFRSSVRWQKFRAWFKRENSLCANPFGTHDRVGGLVPMDDIHHIVSLNDAPESGLDPDNCVALCGPCHRTIEAKNRAGQDTRHLFDTSGANQEDTGQ